MKILTCLLFFFSFALRAESQPAAPANTRVETLPDGGSASLSANRLSGPAPLAVLFDATESKFPGVEFPIHQLNYMFDFGDTKSGRWKISGLPKNTQNGGPLAAHVFDTPGTYTVKLRIQSNQATIGEVSTEITVLDPSDVYAGSKTVCVSNSGNFEGSPLGAARVNAIPDRLTGKRILLRRGESFGAISPKTDEHDFQVGAFGEGPKPKITGVNTGNTPGSVPTDWTVMDLEIGTGAVSVETSTIKFLLYNNDIVQHKESVAMINIGTACGYYQSHGHNYMPWPREVFLVENNVIGKIGQSRKDSPNVVTMGFFWKSALLGNTMDRAYEHTLRIWAAGKTVIAHNALGGNHQPESNGIGIRSALKLHSSGVQPWTDLVADSPKVRTQQVILANNLIGSPTYPGSFLTGMGPQNADPGTVEGLEDCIAENNHYVRGPISNSHKSELQLRGRRMTARGNTLAGGNKPDIVRSGYNYDSRLRDWDGPYFIYSN